MTPSTCKPCKGRGWVRSSDDWTKCADCRGSGEPGVDPGVSEILTSSGRTVRGRFTMYSPAKPKPNLPVAGAKATPPGRTPTVCAACNGEGFWMAPVYHNERVRERCSTCSGTGWIE